MEINISDEEYKQMHRAFPYKALPERWIALNKYFNIEADDIVIDGGAFRGDMAYFFSKKVGPKGRVYAIEPYRPNIRELRNNLNLLNLKNVEILPYALWNKKGRIPFYISPNWSNIGSPVKEFKRVMEEGRNGGVVICNSLDDIVKEHKIPKVDIIWLNVEASEIEALKGMEDTLSKNDCEICISTHELAKGNFTTQEVMDILESYGYKYERVENHSYWIHGWKDE